MVFIPLKLSIYSNSSSQTQNSSYRGPIVLNMSVFVCFLWFRGPKVSIRFNFYIFLCISLYYPPQNSISLSGPQNYADFPIFLYFSVLFVFLFVFLFFVFCFLFYFIFFILCFSSYGVCI